MLFYPEFDPVAIVLGPIAIRWYGLMYFFAFLFVWWYLERARVGLKYLSSKDIQDWLSYSVVGVILGGRFGYALLYGMHIWQEDWLWPLKIWEPGMSFHGAVLGVIGSIFWLSWRKKLSFVALGDLAVQPIPVGLALGRLGNFINGELWGRVTDVPWGMVFPYAGAMPRHPSQLYEAFLEGLVLFAVVRFVAQKTLGAGSVAGVFLVGYGVARIACEVFREPDIQHGFIAFGWLTFGQLLCVPMILLGLYLIRRAQTQPYWRSVL